MDMKQLQNYGWDEKYAAAWSNIAPAGCIPARIIADFGTSLTIVIPEERTAGLSGRMQHGGQPEDFPKVGDWVAVQLQGTSAMIEAVLPRRSEIARKAAGRKAQKQIMAANVDLAFIVQALSGDGDGNAASANSDFSPERIQRYIHQLTSGQANGGVIETILVLNKADKVTNTRQYTDAVAALGIWTIVCSATENQGINELRDMILPGKTAVLLGSSGVGKSTLTNLLVGHDIQQTQAVRQSDSAGRHTTTHRELFVLGNGGMLIDTPGIRELQLWSSQAELDKNFDDIVEYASRCSYRNCRHGSETGCAIRAGLKSGELDRAQYSNYLKMKQELQILAAKPNFQDAIQKQKARQKMYKQSDRDMRGDSEFPN